MAKFRKKPVVIEAVRFDGSMSAISEIIRLAEYHHMNSFDFNKATTLLFSRCFFGVNKHYFTMAILAGMHSQCFALVPEDAKNLSNVLLKTIELYEQQHGPIPDSNKPTPSPIQL